MWKRYDKMAGTLKYKKCLCKYYAIENKFFAMATLSVYNFKNVVLSERRCFLKNDYCFMFYAMDKFEYSGVQMERT